MTTSERRATWLELFFDLAFAAAVAEVGTTLSADYTVAGLLRFSFLFILIWSAWVGHTMFATRFDTDDLWQRLLTLAQMFAVAVMAVNADGPLGGRSSAGFAAAYAGMRLVLVFQYLRASRRPFTRRLALAHAAGIGLGATLWLGSALAPLPLRFWLWGIALAVDVAVPWVLGRLGHRFPPDPAHLPERFGLFTLILLGESVIAVMGGMKRQEFWSPGAAAAAVAGMAIAFALWWAYFDTLRAAAPRTAATPREALLLRRWSWAHFPLCLGIALSAIGVEHVITHDGMHPLPGAGAWLLSGGVALVMLALGVIAASDSSRRSLGPGLALASVTFLAAAFGRDTAPVALLALLLLACLAQIGLSRRALR